MAIRPEAMNDHLKPLPIDPEKVISDEERIAAWTEYGEVLRGIHNRLISEGYVYKDGKFYRESENVKKNDEKV